MGMPSRSQKTEGRRQKGMRAVVLLSVVLVFFPCAYAADKPKVAVFPLAGSASAELRDRCGFALRAKLNRDGAYEAISGPEMADIAASSQAPIDVNTSADIVKKLAADSGAAILIWGQTDAAGDKQIIRLKILDLRQKDVRPREIQKTIDDPTDFRFVTEQILETIPGVKPFEHPSETPVTLDAKSLELWAKNPNLVVDGDFAAAGHWTALYQSEKYSVEISDKLPETDKVNIYRLPESSAPGHSHNALAMRLSEDAAESNGLACISDFIPIVPHTRYRLRFRYQSDGPSLHVFVKGYTRAPNIKGEIVEREIYRRQVPRSGATGGKWAEVIDDLNPQRPGFDIDGLRIDLYVYLSKGTVLFDDVQLKAVGKQTDVAKDDAIKPPGK